MAIFMIQATGRIVVPLENAKRLKIDQIYTRAR